MITFFILLVAPYLILLNSGPHWRLILAVVYAICIVPFLTWRFRKWRREETAIQSSSVATADWRWPEYMPAETFRYQLGLYLMRQGWRVLASRANENGWITLLVLKDRWCVALLCTGAKTLVSPEAITDLEALHGKARVTQTAVVMAEPRPLPKGTELKRKLVFLKLEDLACLDEALGLTLVEA